MSQDEKAATATATPGPKKHRSPSYPVIPIDEAIDRARRIYRQDRRNYAPFESIVQHLDYTVTKKGGRAGRTVAALKQYGLLDERSGQFRISDLAFNIIEAEEGTAEQARLIKEAALSPPLFRKILRQFNLPLPSDTTLRSHLVRNERFNPDTVRDFIRVLRRVVELVNPSPEDYTASEESEGAGEQPPPAGATPMQQQPFTAQPKADARQAFSGAPAGRYPEYRATEEAGQRDFLSKQMAGSPPSEGLNFQVSENAINVTFSGTVTQEIIRKLIKHLEINIEDFPTKADLERQRQANLVKNFTTNPETGKPYTDGMSQEQIANLVNRFVEAGKPPEDE